MYVLNDLDNATSDSKHIKKHTLGPSSTLVVLVALGTLQLGPPFLLNALEPSLELSHYYHSATEKSISQLPYLNKS